MGSTPLFPKFGMSKNFRVQNGAGPIPKREIDHDPTGRAADVAKKLVRPSDAVRGENHVVQVRETVGRCDGLLFEAIERSARDAVLDQRLVKGGFIHDPPSRGVQQIGIGFHTA